MSQGFGFLRENAEEFWREAQRLFEEGRYKLAAFSVEQAVQLYLKHLLAEKCGDFPKTHSLKRLFYETRKFCPELFALFEEKSTVIGDLEMAYIGARYLPTFYTEPEVRAMLEVAQRVRELVDGCLG